MKRILIIGDAARGKTTLAKQLAKTLHLPLHSTDDFFWEKKFSKKAGKQESIAKIKNIYKNSFWIVEGTTKHLIAPGLEKADKIIYLLHPSFLSQVHTILNRHKQRKDETIIEVLILIKDLFIKRYFSSTGRQYLQEMIRPHKAKTVELRSFGEIDRYLNNLK